MEQLLAEGTDPNRSNYLGQKPLVLAARKGMADAVRLLLNAGAAVNHQDSSGSSALLAAAAEGRAAVVELLLQRGEAIIPSIRALREAAEEGHPALVYALLQAGVSVDGIPTDTLRNIIQSVDRFLKVGWLLLPRCAALLELVCCSA